MVKEFAWPVRVYYEDTDAGGVVFYANYLAYMERARTEWLRELGYANSDLATDPGVVFAVRRVEVDYVRPARLDDVLDVTASLTRISRASLSFGQSVYRGTEVLCRGAVQIACVDSRSFRPTAIPRPLLDRIKDE